MRKLLLQMQLSVDGYVSAANGRSDWMVWGFGENWTWTDPRLRQYHIDIASSVDSILLSRKMAAEGFIHYWSKVAGNTANPLSAFATHIRQAKKIVFSKTLQKATWENSELAKGDLAAEVNRLKALEGKNMIAYGGASFAAALVAARLIDEYHFVINPTIVGDGMRIFDELENTLPLRLVHAQPYDQGMVVLVYAAT